MLNAYAGLASAYVIRDLDEAKLIASARFHRTKFPSSFRTRRSRAVADQWGQPGDLGIPASTTRQDLGLFADHLPFPSCVPEFFGDTMLANGLVFPTARVEQSRPAARPERVQRALLHLASVRRQDAAFPASTEPNLHLPGPPFVQIAAEGGFLPDPVPLDGSKTTPLLAPAERADLIVDFSEVPAGST